MTSLDQVPYPYCLNGNEAKSVCLHEKCDMFPFFCSTCQEHDCELKHQHSNKITSISFREFIRHVQQLKRPFPELVEACNTYSKTLLDFQSKVYAFVLKQLKEIEIMKNKPPYLPQKQDEIVMKILNKEYSELRGRDTDLVWMMKPAKPVEDIGYIQSKTEEIQCLAEDFKKLIALLSDNQDDGEVPGAEIDMNPNSKSQSAQLIKIQEQNQNLQKVLRQKQEQVLTLEQSVTSLNKQNQQLILSRDQMMSQYLKNNGNREGLSFIESAKQSDGEQLKEEIKRIAEKEDGSKVRPKESERSVDEIPEHKGGRI